MLLRPLYSVTLEHFRLMVLPVLLSFANAKQHTIQSNLIDFGQAYICLVHSLT